MSQEVSLPVGDPHRGDPHIATDMAVLDFFRGP
jgi:hypothetical protein